MRYMTRDLQEAGFLWSQSYFPAKLVRLQPFTERDGVFQFVMEIEATDELFNEVMFKYNNQEAQVEPRRYDQSLNNLRDHLRKVKTTR